MELFLRCLIGIIIYLSIMFFMYLFFTKIMKFSRYFRNENQKRDWPEDLFEADSRYYLYTGLIGLAIIIAIQLMWEITYDWIFFISLSWSFFSHWFIALINKNKRRKKRNVRTRKTISKEEWLNNYIDKVPLIPSGADNFSDLDQISRNVGTGCHYFRDECSAEDSECNVYRIEVQDRNVLALKMKCVLETTDEGLDISYHLLNYKIKLMWYQFLFASPMVVIWYFLMPAAILLLLIPAGYIFFKLKNHKHELMKETIEYLEDLP